MQALLIKAVDSGQFFFSWHASLLLLAGSFSVPDCHADLQQKQNAGGEEESM